jgi:hypothetical protein
MSATKGTISMQRHSITRLLPAAVLAILMLAAMWAPSAFADFGIKSFDGEVTSDPAGTPDTQAGSHPYAVSTSIFFNTTEDPETEIDVPDGNVKDIHVHLPPGLIGNPAATPQCTQAQFQLSQFLQPGGCPASSQVGVTTIFIDNASATFPVYNLVPHPGVPAEFGFVVLLDPVHAYATIRTGNDYGLDINLDDISQGLAIQGTKLTFWGTPADPRHDTERACSSPTTTCHSEAPEEPFLTLPAVCGIPALTTMTATSWQSPKAAPAAASFVNHGKGGEPLSLDGCDQVPFTGSVKTSLDTPVADSPSGLSVDVHVPQAQGTIATASLRDTEVTLPPGIAIDPSTANGLAGCGLAELGLTQPTPSTCPANSTIGQTEIDTPLVSEPLIGPIYLARQTENPFGSLIAIYAIAEAHGVRVKLPGKLALDPGTGQLVTTFDNTPLLPFSDFKLTFFGGPRSVLATQVTCGTQPVAATLAPWSGTAPISAPASVTVDSAPSGLPCPASAAARPFRLGLEAGTVSNAAALHSPFALKVTRADGQQELGSLDATLPRGLLAVLKGVPTCGNAQAVTGTCGGASLIGSVKAGAGAGTDPFYVTSGRAYLTGPYEGAPLGLDFVVPAVAGPLDLGVVNVRAALFVDPATAQVTVKTDPLPRILLGVPLRLRSLALDVDRGGFIVNPTDCDPGEVSVSAHSVFGATDSLADRFQAAGCGQLAYAPRVRATLLGRGKALRRAGNPKLRVTLTQPAGQANTDDVAVTMPPAINLDQAHIKTICTRVQFAAGKCPPGSIYGHAKAVTPLLEAPLTGPVYLRSSNHKLPDLVADLNGQIEIELDGRIDTKNGGIRTSFTNLPDAAVSKFELTMNGGKRGLLVNKEQICLRQRHATAVIDAKNGRTADQNPVLQAQCGGNGK